MKKSLSERISEKAFQKRLSQKGKNRATILALRQDIKQALDDGWPVKSIWQTLHEEEKIDFSYQAFRGYVSRLITLRNSTESKPLTAIDKGTQPQKTETKKRVTEIINPIPMPGFTYNSIPNVEELF